VKRCELRPLLLLVKCYGSSETLSLSMLTGVMEHRGLEPLKRSKTIKLDKHELKALFERNVTERDDAQAAERVEGMG
jgi:hypothetical protein